MTIFHWNPVRRNLREARDRLEFTEVPITFVPKNYVRQRKRCLYNNLFVLLAGLSALTLSHDMDVPETETRSKLKYILGSGGLCIGHLITVPLIISRLHLHYSIVLGAMGMGVLPFFYYIRNPIILSFVVCLRVVFVALFDVSAMVYIVKLARVCSRIQGNPVYVEVLIMRCLIAIFSCAANVASIGWREYAQNFETIHNDKHCGANFCPTVKSLKKVRLFGVPSAGQNTIFAAVSIVVALSGIILIAMYLKPIATLGDWDLSGEPRVSSPCHVLKQFKKLNAIYLAILVTSCALMGGMTDEFLLAYVTCRHPRKYGFYIRGMKQMSVMFGVLSCITLVDITGFRWLYALALCGQLASYACLVLWNPDDFTTAITYLMVYHMLCVSSSVETSVLQLLVIQTLGDEEVSAWCFYYFLVDVVYLIRSISDAYLCTGVKLWILIGMSPIAVIAITAYWYKFDSNIPVALDEHCSQLIKTPTKMLTKEFTFDLRILIERSEGIRTVETLLQRNYCLKSRYLLPPPDDVFSDFQSTN